MSNQKSGIKGWLSGLKSLANINVILIICLNILNSYGNNVNNTIKSLAGIQTIGLTPAVVGAAASVFTIVAFLCRPAYTYAIDKIRSKLKMFLLIGFFIRAAIFLSLNVVSNAATYYLFFVVDGFMAGFMGTTIPALIGMAVDRKAMGSGFAVMNFITQLVIAPSRPNAANWFRELGLLTPTMVAAGCMAVAGIICVILKINAVPGRVQREAEQPKIAAQPKKKGIIALYASGISTKLIPFALVSSIAVVLMAADKTFFQVYAEGLNIGSDYTKYQTLGGSMGSFVSLATGILCDLINPAILVYVALIGQGTGMLLYVLGATNPSLFYAGILIYYTCRYMNDVFRILSVKVLPKSQVGAATSTIFFFNDMFTMAANTGLGILATKMGYQSVWIFLAGLSVFNILFFTYTYNNGFKQLANTVVEED